MNKVYFMSTQKNLEFIKLLNQRSKTYDKDSFTLKDIDLKTAKELAQQVSTLMQHPDYTEQELSNKPSAAISELPISALISPGVASILGWGVSPGLMLAKKLLNK